MKTKIFHIPERCSFSVISFPLCTQFDQSLFGGKMRRRKGNISPSSFFDRKKNPFKFKRLMSILQLQRYTYLHGIKQKEEEEGLHQRDQKAAVCSCLPSLSLFLLVFQISLSQACFLFFIFFCPTDLSVQLLQQPGRQSHGESSSEQDGMTTELQRDGQMDGWIRSRSISSHSSCRSDGGWKEVEEKKKKREKKIGTKA